MLACTLTALSKVCTNAPGGVAAVWYADREDINFTQTGNSYTAMAFNVGATAPAGSFKKVPFIKDTAGASWKKTRKGCSTGYEYEVKMDIAEQDEALTTFLTELDKCSCCGGLVVLLQMFGGNKIHVIGEKWVGGVETDEGFRITQDTGEWQSGVMVTEENKVSLTFGGNYTRPPHQYTGGLASIL